jgi:hypothetical protein
VNHPAQADEAKGMTDERDLAHEADMRELMREQFEADCGGEMADELDEYEDDFMGDPDEYDDDLHPDGGNPR